MKNLTTNNLTREPYTGVPFPYCIGHLASGGFSIYDTQHNFIADVAGENAAENAVFFANAKRLHHALLIARQELFRFYLARGSGENGGGFQIIERVLNSIDADLEEIAGEEPYLSKIYPKKT